MLAAEKEEIYSELYVVPREQNRKAASKNYAFIDFIRFVSMVGIVFIHTYITPEDLHSFIVQTDHPVLYILARQFFKFASICFFIVSGFLLFEKFDNKKSFDFYKRRFKAMWKPYIIAFFITFSFIVFKDYFFKHKPFVPFTVIKELTLYSSFWFVPNILFALLLITILLKFFKFTVTGLILFFFLLLSTINTVYVNKQLHTFAFSGFAFYLWLGMFVNKKNLISKISSLKLIYLMPLVLLTWLSATSESYLLSLKENLAPITFNTLCVTNQIYSLCVFILLIKIAPFAPKFKFLNPRKETYPIYLYHTLVVITVSIAIKMVQKVFNLNIFYASINTGHTILLSIINFIICYSIATAIVKILIKQNLFYLAK